MEIWPPPFSFLPPCAHQTVCDRGVAAGRRCFRDHGSHRLKMRTNAGSVIVHHGCHGIAAMSSKGIVTAGGAGFDAKGAGVTALIAEPTPTIRTNAVRTRSFCMGNLLFYCPENNLAALLRNFSRRELRYIGITDAAHPPSQRLER